eukprot:10832416-Karenia_brevis.AAC.1
MIRKPRFWVQRSLLGAPIGWELIERETPGYPLGADTLEASDGLFLWSHWRRWWLFASASLGGTALTAAVR